MSLLERADQILARGTVPAGMAPVVAVAAVPPDPGNAVLLLTRRGGAPAQITRALPDPAGPDRSGQWFRAALPAVEEGRSLAYRIELVRAGRRVAGLPADGSWLTVTGERSAPEVPPPGGAPHWDYDLRFFAAVTAVGRLEVVGETADGYRANFLVDGGRLSGPGIEAVIRPGGGDWLCVRRDGVASLDIRATAETALGAVILYRAGGVLDLGPDGYARIATGRLSGCPPFYATPVFRTAAPEWQWLSRVQGLGMGRVMLEERRVEYDIYVPRVGDRRPGG